MMGLARSLRRSVLAASTLGLLAIVPTVQAFAQAIAAVVNGDPFTTTDVDERMKYLRVIHKPASRADAIEDLVSDFIKLREANRNGIDATDNDLQQTLNRLASSLHTDATKLSNDLVRARVDTNEIRTHLHALAAWNNFVKARNKFISVTDTEINAALAKGGQSKENTDYTLQQIVFVLPAKAGMGEVESRMKEAQSLRSRFSDCPSGLSLARALPDVGIKPTINRTGASLSSQMRSMLDGTPRGHLTPPERIVEGIQMIAVCGVDDGDRTTMRENVQNDLITERLSKISEQMYQDLRKRAVVEKR